MASVTKRSSSPSPTDLLNMNWRNSFKSHIDVGGLDAVVDFDSKHDAKDHASIDPQLLMTNMSSSGSDLNHLTEQFQQNHPENDGLEKLFCADAVESHESQPSDPFDLTRSSCYNDFSQSMEQPVYYTAPIPKQFRRSISEPPTGSPHGSPVGLEVPMQHGITFHRDSQYLGQPIGESALKMKNIPKPKQHRQHPYSRKTQQAKAKQNNQLAQVSYLPFQHQWLPSVSHVQRKIPRPPTSDPLFATSDSICMDQTHQCSLVSSRVCSPIPRSPAHMNQAVDHTLKAFGPSQPHDPQDLPNTPPKQVVHIQVSIEQLQKIVTKAVRDAINVEKRAPTIANSEKLSAECHDD